MHERRCERHVAERETRPAGCLARRPYLLVDGWTQLDQQEAVGDHRKNTQCSGEQDGQPYAGLAQRVPSCSWSNNTAAKVVCVCVTQVPGPWMSRQLITGSH